MKYSIFFAALMAASPSIFASQPTGKISKLAFYGSGTSEVMFVTMDSDASVCPYRNRYVMTTKDRTATTAALLSAFHTQSTIILVGTGLCHSSWGNDEGIESATLSR